MELFSIAEVHQVLSKYYSITNWLLWHNPFMFDLPRYLFGKK